MPFREPTRQEQTLINRALGRWDVFDALKEQAFLLHEGSSKVCMMTLELASIVRDVKPDVAGLAIGEISKKQFTPTLAGASLFARVCGSGKKHYIKVGENAEKLVLYGRDVMGESISNASPELRENELVIILNLREEAIGIGRTRFSGRSILQKGRVTITTIADAGSYLRDEGDNHSGFGGEERRAKMMTMGRQAKKVPG